MKVIAVNTSDRKGTVKKPVPGIVLNMEGIENDAHAGPWHRQVSLLGIESIRRFEKETGRPIAQGEFAENITTEGLELSGTSPLSLIQNDNIILEITQIGKKCHGSSCSIYKELGDCIMPKEGIFARVKKAGGLKAGDILDYSPKIVKAFIITLSDRASKGQYKDVSGPLIAERLEKHVKDSGWDFEAGLQIIPDEIEVLQNLLQSKIGKFDLVFTTGSTGIGPRDIAPEAVRPLLDKEIPGIMELIRVKYGMEKHNALLSRSLAGVIEKTLIYCLPGSPRAIEEYTGEIFKTLKHSLLMLNSIDQH
ncbi:molybdenum cofactor synthesis domain-containing protein [Bacteroidota bacterium]